MTLRLCTFALRTGGQGQLRELSRGEELKETDTSWVEDTEWRTTVTEGFEDPHLALDFPLTRSIERLIK